MVRKYARRLCSFYPTAYHAQYPIACPMSFVVSFLLFERGGDHIILTGVAKAELMFIYFCPSHVCLMLKHHKLLLSLAFLDHFIIFMSVQKEKLCHWCPRLSRSRRNTTTDQLSVLLSMLLEELVFVWDVQCYNVNTADADDLLCEKPWLGNLCYQRNLEPDSVQ